LCACLHTLTLGTHCRYQFNPAETNIDTIAKILVKALMQLPANDFTLYLSLLSDAVVRCHGVAAPLASHAHP
jgi:hypothetical protein